MSPHIKSWWEATLNNNYLIIFRSSLANAEVHGPNLEDLFSIYYHLLSLGYQVSLMIIQNPTRGILTLEKPSCKWTISIDMLVAEENYVSLKPQILVDEITVKSEVDKILDSSTEAKIQEHSSTIDLFVVVEEFSVTPKPPIVADVTSVKSEIQGGYKRMPPYSDRIRLVFEF